MLAVTNLILFAKNRPYLVSFCTMSLQIELTLTGHSEDRVWHAAWSPSGRHLATCGEDKVVRIWAVDAKEGRERFECVATLEDGQSRTIRSCEWNPFGDMIASASFDGTVLVWEAQSSTLVKWDVVASLEGHASPVTHLECDDDVVVSASKDGTLRLWSSGDGSLSLWNAEAR